MYIALPAGAALMWTRRVLHLSLLSALIGTTACFSEITLKSYREGVRVNILCLRPKGGEIGRWRWTLKAFDKEEVSEVLQVSRYNGTITTNGLETLLSFPDGTRLPCSVTVACSWKGGGPAFDPWAIAKKTTLSGEFIHLQYNYKIFDDRPIFKCKLVRVNK